MKILVVSPHPPNPKGGGSPTRLYYLLRELAKVHEVDAIIGECWGGETPRELLEPLCTHLHVAKPLPRNPSGGVWERRFRRWVRWFVGPASDVRDVLRIREPVAASLAASISRSRPDLIYVHHSMGAVVITGVSPQIPVLIDLHNVMCSYYFRSLKLACNWRQRLEALREALKMFAFERQLFQSAAKFVTCSVQDASVVQRMAELSTVNVVPNGVDYEHFAGQPGGDPTNLLFLGTLSYLPNSDAVSYCVHEILPKIRSTCPEVRLTVIGMEPPPEILDLDNGSSVRIVGQVDDVRCYSRKSAIHLVPIRLGSGTRLKILEALAMGRAVVSTSIGAEGLDLEDGIHLFIADTAEEFARKAIMLINNPDLRERVALAGQSFVRQNYDWPRVGEALLRACHSAVNYSI